MVQMNGVYIGEKRCQLVHEPSGTKINTDAPRDNHGRGEAFSPSDLLGAALGSCILTTMAIHAEREGVMVQGASFTVQKEMQASPRKIAALPLQIRMPAGISAEWQQKLMRIAESCPIAKSLHPDIESKIDWVWG